MNDEKVCDICNVLPCACEISEADYEYGEQSSTPPATPEMEKCEYCDGEGGFDGTDGDICCACSGTGEQPKSPHPTPAEWLKEKMDGKMYRDEDGELNCTIDTWKAAIRLWDICIELHSDAEHIVVPIRQELADRDGELLMTKQINVKLIEERDSARKEARILRSAYEGE